VNIIIREEFIQDKCQTIIKNSEEEEEFVNELKNKVGNIDATNIPDSNLLEKIMQEFTFITENLWAKYSKYVNITKCFKVWLNEECNRDLFMYCTFRSRFDWKKFKKTVKKTKRSSLMKNSRNYVEEQEAVEPYELGQEMQATSHKSYQIQWVSMY